MRLSKHRFPSDLDFQSSGCHLSFGFPSGFDIRISDFFRHSSFVILPQAPMLKCSTSLWSADLANLASDIRRVEPYSERFHLDVADGHYVKNLLSFPDQVKALRPHTRVPFEVHLMVTDPLGWIEPFVEAGADGFIFCFDSMKNPGEILRAAKSTGKFAGVSLLITEPLDLLTPYWEQLDIVTI